MSNEHSVVVHSNQVTRAAYRLTMVEYRIVFTAISKIPHNALPSDETIYWCTAEDLVDLGSDLGSVYSQLRKATETLFDRAISVAMDDGASRKFRWVQEVIYRPGEGRIGVRFSKPMLPFLFAVKSSFTKYRLLDLKGLSSEYAVRLYIMCAQYADTHWMTISIKELREILMLGNKYSVITMFQARVLDTAVNQINASESCAFKVSYKLQKTGRAYTDIRFTITPKIDKKGFKLTKKQAFYFASLVLADQDVWPEFYRVAQTAGLNLRGIQQKIVCAEIVAKWLSEPSNVEQVLDSLSKVGFKYQAKKPASQKEAQEEP